MKSGSAYLGLVALATLGSCGKGGADIASVLLVSAVEVTPSSGALVLGGTAQLSAVPKTASGITIPGRTIVWASSNESAVSVSSTGLITAHALGGPVHITATVDGVTGESLITVQPFPVDRVTVAPNPLNVVVGQFNPLTATAFDANGNPLPGRVISWQSSNSAVAAVTTDGVVLGVAEGGPVTITATSEGKSGTASVNVVPRPATKLGFVQQPGASTAGQAITPAVRVAIQNELGGTVTAANSQVTIALGANPGGGTLSGTLSVAAVNGIATFSNLSINRASNGYTLTATSGSLTSATSSAFTVGAGAASQLIFSTSPPGAAGSGVPLSPQPGLQLVDVLGNAVAQAGVVVTASLGSGTATLSGGTSATTNTAGIASFSGLTLNGSGTTVTLTFSAPGITSVTSGPIVLGAGTAGALAMVTQPSASAQSGIAFAVQPRVELRDASGNDVNQGGVAITAAIASGPAGATLNGTTSAVTGSNGTAQFDNLAITGAAGSYTLRFSSGALTPVVSSPIVLSAGPGATLAIVTQPSASVANGAVLPQQPSIQLRDPANNPVTQAGVQVTATLQNGGTLGGNTTVATNASGVATFSNLSITGTVGSRTLLFAAAGYVSVTSNPINVTAGPASQLTITTQPASFATSGEPFAPQPVLQLRDVSSNPVSQAGVAVTAAIASGGGTLGGTVTVSTNSSGTANYTNLEIQGSPGNRTLSFSSPGLTSATSTAISVQLAPPTQLTVTTQPSSSAVSGVAFATQPAIQLRNALGLAVNTSGVVVTAAIASGGGTLGGTTTATTNSSGLATFTNLSITGTPGSRTLGFSSPGLTGATSTPINITAAAATKLTITTQPSSSAVTGEPFSTQPVIQLRDASDNAVSQSGVSVTAAIASGGGTLGGTATVTTNASGVASFTNLSITGSAGSRTLSFSSGSLTPATSTAINLTAAPATQLDLTTQPPATAASGVTFSVAPVIQLENSSGGAVSQSNVLVTVSVATGAATLGGTLTVATDATGKATFSGLSLTGPTGSHTLRFTATGLTEKISGTITLGAGPASKLAVVTEPSATSKSGDQFNQQPAVRILDSAGNPVASSGVTITAAINTGTGSLGGDTTKNTNGSGIATFTDLRITGSGPHTLKFTATGLTQVISATITVSP